MSTDSHQEQLSPIADFLFAYIMSLKQNFD